MRDYSELSDAELDALIAQEVAKEQGGEGSFTRDLAIGAKNLGVGALTAIPDTLSFVGNAPFYAANVAGYLSGNEGLKNLPAPLPYASEYLNQGIDLVTDNYFQPQNLQEKVIGTASNLVGGGKAIAKSAATQVAPLVQKYFAPQNAKDYLSLATAGAGLEGAREIAPESTAAQLGGAAIGGLLPGARGTLASMLKVNPEKYTSFERAGLNPTLADVSDSRVLKGAQNALVEAPLTGSPITDSITKTKGEIESSFSKGLVQENAGELAQKGLRSYQQRGQEVAHKLQRRMASHLPGDMPIPINKTLSAIDSQIQFTTPEARQQFAASAVGKEYKKLTDIAARDNGTIPYQDLVYFRQTIDDQISNFGLMGLSKEQGALKNLRGQIQADIGNTFKQVGPQAAKDFERFNKFYTAFARKNEDVINGLLKDKTATEAFRSITQDLKVDAGKADAVLKTLKGEQKQVFSQSLIRELGQSPQNEFNVANLATNFKKLEPRAQEIVLAPMTKEVQQQFRSTIDAIDAMKGTLAAGNPSGTFNQGLRVSAGVGAFTNLPLTAGVLLGGNLSARLMTNPKFISWLAKTPELTDAAQVGKHIGALSGITKASPELAPDIARYLDSVESQEQSLSAAPNEPNFQNNEFEGLSDEELDRQIELEQQNVAPQQQIPPQSQNNGGVSPELINKISQIESGGNPNARAQGSTASGILQFTNPTWKDGVEKYGAQAGVTLRDKNNPEAQRKIAAYMLKDNAKELTNVLGRSPHPTEIYLTHFLGLNGTKALLSAHPNQFAAQVLPKAAKANRSVFFQNGKPITVAQLYQNFSKKVGKMNS